MAKSKNDNVAIVAYKYDGSLHRVWKKATILDATNDHIICLNDNTLVSESTGRKWYTKEPAICIFYPNKWFNVIGMIRKKGIYFYSNLASPAVYEKGAIKYIDFELDVKIFPDGVHKVLDKDEYHHAKLTMEYPDHIDKILWKELDNLIQMVKAKQPPFCPDYINQWYTRYQELKNKK